MSATDIISLLNDAGVVGLLVLLLLTGARGYWVFGRTHREALVRESEWRSIALTALELTEQERSKPDA